MLHVGKSCYYTPNDLSSFLVSQIPEGTYRDAVDICCGSWNLLGAVKRRWPEVEITGIDLDGDAKEKAPHESKFILGDGRLHSLKFIKRKKIFDIVVANPPFGKISKCLYSKLPNYKNVDIKGTAKKRIETDMIFANASLVNENGWLIAIVPSSFIEAVSYLSIRKQLASDFFVRAIVKLPDKIFSNKEVKSYALILNKLSSARATSHLCETLEFKAFIDENGWKKELLRSLPLSSIKLGNWAPSIPEVRDTLTNIKIYRGLVSSNQFSKIGTPLLHSNTVEVGQHWEPSVRYFNSEVELAFKKIAYPGDIVMSRVGRSAGYWCIYRGCPTIISDCLIVLRAKPMHTLVSLLKDCSEDGCLKSFVKGITAQYVTQKELLLWLGKGKIDKDQQKTEGTVFNMSYPSLGQ